MIPNIFVSSTIVDLNYLRDALRDAIEELCYHPVMSEHGEVGYIYPNTAADSCKRSVQHCQIMVLIIGKRYGSIGPDGRSITHREFLAAKEEQVPIITFVDPAVLHYKDVYRSNPKSDTWDDFDGMDNPRKTFELLDEICGSESYNSMIKFDSAGDARKKLKLQLADFVGDRLGAPDSRMKGRLSDILAEVKTVRNLLTKNSDPQAAKRLEIQKFLVVARLLLNEKLHIYREVVAILFGSLDRAIEELGQCESFDAVLASTGHTCESFTPKAMATIMEARNNEVQRPDELVIMTFRTGDDTCLIYDDKRLQMNTSFLKFLHRCHGIVRKEVSQTDVG